jgi:hypothetical protein
MENIGNDLGNMPNPGKSESERFAIVFKKVAVVNAILPSRSAARIARRILQKVPMFQQNLAVTDERADLYGPGSV